jgi:oxygen-independent coproporphyrinogen-3 oxidase
VKHSDDLIALGMSSISAVAGRFAQNDADLKGYSKAIDSGRPATVKGMVTGEDDRIRQYAIAELMCNLRLDLPEISHRFDIRAADYLSAGLNEMEPMIEDGFLHREDSVYRVTPLGKLFLRNIAMPFDAYLGDAPGDGKFSKTI